MSGRRIRGLWPKDAWLPAPGYNALKLCPNCGESALEGEVVCSRCGVAPLNDWMWLWVGHPAIRARA